MDSMHDSILLLFSKKYLSFACTDPIVPSRIICISFARTRSSNDDIFLPLTVIQLVCKLNSLENFSSSFAIFE